MPLVFKDPKFRRVNLTLSVGELASIYYHDIFDYPLHVNELGKWRVNENALPKSYKNSLPGKLNKIGVTKAYLHIKDKKNLIIKRKMSARASLVKIKSAHMAANILTKIPSIKFIGITGSLAMQNASPQSDIDLLIITQKNLLWTSRFLSYALLKFSGIKVRNPGTKEEKDKLCLNIWLDETTLSWPKNNRNIFTAHEIAQIKPLINKNKTFERFLRKNEWVKDYWPGVEIGSGKWEVGNKRLEVGSRKCEVISRLVSPLEYLARQLQLLYMSGKRTREVAEKHKALFHPVDWSKMVVGRFEQLM